MEPYPEGYKVGGQYAVLLLRRAAVVKQQLLIVEEANGKLVYAYNQYVRPDYTIRVMALRENLASLAEDLLPFVAEAAGVTA